MDTTHTFHLPFGEMTVTPLNFAAITRLNFYREHVLFSSKAYSFVVVKNRWLRDSFGVMTPMKFGCSSLIRYTHLVEKVRLEHDTGSVSLEQLARCFLFYLFSAIILANASGTFFL